MEDAITTLAVWALGIGWMILALKLQGDNDRLRRGDFTREEFQRLCHNMDEKGTPFTRADHESGCREYQDQLFGAKKHD